MKQVWKVVLVVVLMGGGTGVAQTTDQTVINPSGQHIVVAGQVPPVIEARKLNDRQKALADETDRLLSMAAELKAQVDMTSKNILSIKVVRKAEEIELYARRMKGEAKR